MTADRRWSRPTGVSRTDRGTSEAARRGGFPIEIIGIVALAIGLTAFYRGSGFALRAFVPTTLFGAAAALNLDAVGSIQPAHLLLAFLIVIAFAERGALAYGMGCLHYRRPGFWLLCTWLYGVIAAIFLPRLFQGQLMVNAIGTGAVGAGFTQTPLAPTTGNITQSIYFTSDLMCFLVCSVCVRTKAGFRALTLALLVYGAADIVLALIDLTTYWTGTVFILDFIRNARYAVFVDNDPDTLKRIIGSFTEASAFAYATLGSFAFALQLWIANIYVRWTLPIAISSLLLLLFSTSTTAYVALPPTIVLTYAVAVTQLIRRRASSNALVLAILAPLLSAIAVIVIMLDATLYATLRSFFEAMVVNKASSQSGIERALFNQQAWQSFIDSRGIGLGIGSVRASSFILAAVASLGVGGTAVYAMFITKVLTGTGRLAQTRIEREVKIAARFSCFALLVAATTSGALVDLGLPFFIFAALASASCMAPRSVKTPLPYAGQMAPARHEPLAVA